MKSKSCKFISPAIVDTTVDESRNYKNNNFPNIAIKRYIVYFIYIHKYRGAHKYNYIHMEKHNHTNNCKHLWSKLVLNNILQQRHTYTYIYF